MNNLITALFRHVKENEVDSEPFEYDGAKLSWEQATQIVMELNDDEYTINKLSEKVLMLEDYNRLLREENTRLRELAND